MTTINNRCSLSACLPVGTACLCLALVLSLWAEKDESTRPNDRMVKQVSIESPSAVFLNEAEIDSPITISGKSNLPAGSIIRIALFAKTSSFAGNRFELLNTYRAIIDQSGKWRYEIKPVTEMPFWAEAYKIEIGTEAKTICCHYFSIASPLACKQRQQEIHSLYQAVTEIWNLDRELKDSISNIEDIKQRKTGWERNIQQTLGIYNSPEEALALAIKKWREWESDYTKKLEILSDSLQARPSPSNFITVQEQLSYLSACLYERYAQYRAQLLGSPRKISYYPAGSGLLNPADNRNNALAIMEREIVSKIFQDTLSLMEYVDGAIGATGPQWQKSRSESIKLCATLKNELEYYYRIGLFYRTPNKHFLKESQELAGLIDTLALLLDKLTVADDKTKNSEEIQTLGTNLHNKITALNAEVY
jgi:hypothetical protein